MKSFRHVNKKEVESMTEREQMELKMVLLQRRLNWYRDFSKEQNREFVGRCTDENLKNILDRIKGNKTEWELIRKKHRERIQRIREEWEEKKL